MRQFFTVLSGLFPWVIIAPMPSDQPVDVQAYSGRGTWFDVGLGACGKWNGNKDKIVALSTQLYGSGQHCDKRVRITNTANRKTASGIVRDECPECSKYSLDMSPSLFEELGDLDQGVLSISWEFI